MSVQIQLDDTAFEPGAEVRGPRRLAAGRAGPRERA